MVRQFTVGKVINLVCIIITVYAPVNLQPAADRFVGPSAMLQWGTLISLLVFFNVMFRTCMQN